MRQLLKDIIEICYQSSNILEPIFYQILYMSVIASIVGIIILIIRKIFDKKIPPKLKQLMWIIVIISLIIPINIKSIFSIYNINDETKKVTQIENISYRDIYEKVQEENGADTIIFDRVWAEKKQANPDGDFTWAPEKIYTIEEIENREQNIENSYIKHLIIDVVIPILWLAGLIIGIIYFAIYNLILNLKIKKSKFIILNPKESKEKQKNNKKEKQENEEQNQANNKTEERIKQKQEQESEEQNQENNKHEKQTNPKDEQENQNEKIKLANDEKRLETILQKAQAKLNIKTNKVKIILQERIKKPAIYGIITPKILLNQEILKLDDKTIEYIIMHELAHYKGKDLLKNYILLILDLIYWFNPIIWIILKAIKNDIEPQADARVLKILNEQEKEEYMLALVKVCAIDTKIKVIDSVICMADNKRNLKRRIKLIKSSKTLEKYKYLITTIVVILTIVLGITFLSKPETEKTHQGNSGENQEGQESTEEEQISESFPNPDRLIYKPQNEENWYVIDKTDKDYETIVKMISDCILQEKRPTNMDQDLYNDEIEELEKENSYIIFDYNTISKNYEIFLDNETYQMIQLYDYNNYSIENKMASLDNVKEYLEKIKNNKNKYNLNEYYQYKTENGIKEIPKEYKDKMRYYEEEDVYRLYINSKKELEKTLKDLNLEISEDIKENIFENCNGILMLSKTTQKDMEYKIGHINFVYSDKISENNEYIGELLLINKVVNQNCIYLQKTREVQVYGEKEGKVLSTAENEIKLNRDVGGTLTLKIDENTKITNYRTEEEMSINDIQVGDYILIFDYNAVNESNLLGIDIRVIKNLQDEDLKEEILSQPSIGGTITKAEIETNGTAIITYQMDDIGQYYTNENENNEYVQIEMKFKVNQNTKLSGYGLNSIRDLNTERAINQMCTIKIDKSTKQEEYPTVTEIDVYDG